MGLIKMKKVILLGVSVVAALAAVAGTAFAAKPGASVTIALAKPSVVFGVTDVLSGTVTNKQAGEMVVVLGQAFGAVTFLPLATITTTTGGAWTYTASPKIQTAYEAQWTTSTSRTLAVKVHPALTLTKVTLSGNRGTFSVTATANRSFAGKFVLVQRLAASGVVQLKKVVLGSASSATFTIRVQPGNSRLRAVMPTSQTQPGYSAAQSAVLTIHS
jgi:hypothetical protein